MSTHKHGIQNKHYSYNVVMYEKSYKNKKLFFKVSFIFCCQGKHRKGNGLGEGKNQNPKTGGTL